MDAKKSEVNSKIEELMAQMGAKVTANPYVVCLDEDSRVPGGSRLTRKQRQQRKVRNTMAKRSRRTNRGR